MSQVMPDTGIVSTDGEVLPEVYHQAVKTMLAHRGNPILIREARVIFITATRFYKRVAIAPSRQFQKIDFGNSMPIWSSTVPDQAAPHCRSTRRSGLTTACRSGILI